MAAKIYIAVFGATGKTGREFVKQALKAGYGIKAIYYYSGSFVD